MLCPRCRRYFCYICGVQAGHNSTHWLFGNPCPRWKQSDNLNASFDPITQVHIDDAEARGRRPEINRRTLYFVVRRDRLKKLAEGETWTPPQRRYKTVRANIRILCLAAYDHFLSISYPPPQRIPAAAQTTLKTFGQHMNQLIKNAAVYLLEFKMAGRQHLDEETWIELREGHKKMLASEQPMRRAVGALEEGGRPWKAEVIRIWEDYRAAAAFPFDEPEPDDRVNLNRLDGIPDAD